MWGFEFWDWGEKILPFVFFHQGDPLVIIAAGAFFNFSSLLAMVFFSLFGFFFSLFSSVSFPLII